MSAGCLRLAAGTVMALALALSAALVAQAAPSAPARGADAVTFAPHRAVYDLHLLRTRGNRQIEAVRGRILYDFSGNACEGYALKFRQVSELDSGEGKSALTDLRTTTWEDGDARTFRFSSENRMNDRVAETVAGTAERSARSVDVSLKKPKTATFRIPRGAVFPTEHMRRIVEAARAGKSVLELPAYDGSDTGRKVYDTLTVIGRAIAPDERKPDDASAGRPELAGMTRWPVTISYFDRDKAGQSGEQTPVYTLQFELFDNGISRALVLDYQDFVISGELSSLELGNTAVTKTGPGKTGVGKTGVGKAKPCR